MLCRDADACFWIGRYVERAEATARMVDVYFHATLEGPHYGENGLESGVSQAERWNSLLNIARSQAAFPRDGSEPSDRDLLHFIAFDTANANSILATWQAARENGRAIREQLASEMWESLNVTYLELRSWDVDRLLAVGPHAFFQYVKNSSHLFQGILNRTMLMGEARDWLDAGRFLERANQTARLLDVRTNDLLAAAGGSAAGDRDPQESIDMHGWIAVLKSVSAYEMYGKVHHGGIKPASVVGFLVLNAQLPASVHHGVRRVEACMKRISGNQRDEPATEPERLLGRMRADLTYARPEEIMSGDLHAFLESLQQQCNAVGDAVRRTYLSY
jgi:uncharacterized alpha-E superfamily protein